MKRKLAILIALTMVTCNTLNAYAVNFSDMDCVPWKGATTYINAIADLGIMVGDTNSNGSSVFRANDRVTYFESIQLIYSIFTKDNKINSSDNVTKWKDTLTENSIPEWAYPAVSFALENNIVKDTELYWSSIFATLCSKKQSYFNLASIGVK